MDNYSPLVLFPILAAAYLLHFAFKAFDARPRRNARDVALQRIWAGNGSSQPNFVALDAMLAQLQPEKEFQLDSQTMDDLEFERLYCLADRTITPMGQLDLYRVMTRMEPSLEVLNWRDEASNEISSNDEFRNEIRSRLYDHGRIESVPELIEAVYGRLPKPLQQDALYRVCYVAATGAVCLLLFAATGWVPLTMATGFALMVFCCNMLVHYLSHPQMAPTEIMIRNVVAFVRATQFLSRCSYPSVFQNLATGLSQASAKSRCIVALYDRTHLILLPTQFDPIGIGRGIFELVNEYVSIFFLRELRSHRKLLILIEAHRESLQRLFDALGCLDSIQSIAALRASTENWVRPTLDRDCDRIELRDAVHPLIKDATANSIVIGSNVIVTGSNMSGKSSFLRTIGVNALLAQTVCTCTCSLFRAPPLYLSSSLSVTDSLATGKSTFFAQAERLREIVRRCTTRTHTLALIDEILHGTNSKDRIEISAAVLRFISGRGSFVVASTHDLELVDAVRPDFEAFYFDCELKDGDHIFDHKIRRGIATTTNAVTLLSALDFPQEIIDALNTGQNGM